MRELNLNRKRLKGIFLSLCLIIISIGILGAYALHTSPFLSFNSSSAPFIKEHLFTALKSGASGYLLKDSPPAEIIESIEEIYNGGSPMSPKVEAVMRAKKEGII